MTAAGAPNNHPARPRGTPASEAARPVQRRNLIEASLALIAVGLLLGVSLQTLMPFLGVLLWATILAVAGWPIAGQLRRHFGIGQFAAAAGVASLYVLGLALPLLYLSVTIFDIGDETAALIETLLSRGLPPPPAFIMRIPLIGSKLAALWQQDQHNIAALLAQSQGALMLLGQVALRQMTDLASALAELGYGILLAFQLLVAGPKVTRVVQRGADALGGTAGTDALDATARAIWVVTLGVLGGALVETALSWFAFMVLGLPLAPVLALLCFVFRLLQVGPWPVWIAASLWLWFIEAKLGTTLALAGWVAVTVVIRSWLERKAVRLGDAVPKALLFLAVLGGLIAWGFSGMFLGAASISVAWTLMHSWLQLDRAEPTD